MIPVRQASTRRKSSVSTAGLSSGMPRSAAFKARSWPARMAKPSIRFDWLIRTSSVLAISTMASLTRFATRSNSRIFLSLQRLECGTLQLDIEAGITLAHLERRVSQHARNGALIHPAARCAGGEGVPQVIEAHAFGKSGPPARPAVRLAERVRRAVAVAHQAAAPVAHGKQVPGAIRPGHAQAFLEDLPHGRGHDDRTRGMIGLAAARALTAPARFGRRPQLDHLVQEVDVAGAQVDDILRPQASFAHEHGSVREVERRDLEIALEFVFRQDVLRLRFLEHLNPARTPAAGILQLLPFALRLAIQQAQGSDGAIDAAGAQFAIEFLHRARAVVVAHHVRRVLAGAGHHEFLDRGAIDFVQTQIPQVTLERPTIGAVQPEGGRTMKHLRPGEKRRYVLAERWEPRTFDQFRGQGHAHVKQRQALPVMAFGGARQFFVGEPRGLADDLALPHELVAVELSPFFECHETPPFRRGAGSRNRYRTSAAVPKANPARRPERTWVRRRP